MVKWSDGLVVVPFVLCVELYFCCFVRLNWHGRDIHGARRDEPENSKRREERARERSHDPSRMEKQTTFFNRIVK